MFQTFDISSKYRKRREFVFLILAGLFLGSLVMLNILGVSRFIDLSFNFMGTEIPFILAVGVLPYPITFLCTDLISELYGKQRASMLVWIGLILNIWVIFVLWIGGSLNPPEGLVDGKLVPFIDETGQAAVPAEYSFYHIRYLTFGATLASMIAYLTAQFCDVHIFHFLKKLTKGKHLWLRNNGSTLISQLVDSFAVILITYFYANTIPIEESEPIFGQLMALILSSYVFKLVVALADTLPFYLGVYFFKKYLNIDNESNEIEM